jgi:hypothetical protein
VVGALENVTIEAPWFWWSGCPVWWRDMVWGQLFSPPDFLEAGKYYAAGVYRSVSDTRMCMANAPVFPSGLFAVRCCVADGGVGKAGVAGWRLGMWLAANRRSRGVGHKQNRLVTNLAIHYYIVEANVGGVLIQNHRNFTTTSSTV